MRIPMYIDITGYKVLVLGGGYEATKKVRRFIRYRPIITVYSLEFSDELVRMSNEENVSLVKGDVRDIDKLERLITENDIVIYTVPGLEEVEKKVREICVKHRKLHILSTNAQLTQVAMPVEIEIHGLKFTAYSAGRSTLVALLALDEIEKCLKPKRYLSILLEAMSYLKTYMKKRGIPYKTRMRMYRELINDERLWKLATEEKLDEAISYVKKKVDTLVD